MGARSVRRDTAAGLILAVLPLTLAFFVFSVPTLGAGLAIGAVAAMAVGHLGARPSPLLVLGLLLGGYILLAPVRMIDLLVCWTCRDAGADLSNRIYFLIGLVVFGVRCLFTVAVLTGSFFAGRGTWWIASGRWRSPRGIDGENC